MISLRMVIRFGANRAKLAVLFVIVTQQVPFVVGDRSYLLEGESGELANSKIPCIPHEACRDCRCRHPIVCDIISPPGSLNTRLFLKAYVP